MLIPTKQCLQCNKEFPKTPALSRRAWEKTKYCSKPCYWIARQGMTLTRDHIEKLRIASTGRKHTSEAIQKMSGEKAHRWKGGLPKCIDCGERVVGRNAVRCKSCRYTYQHGENAGNWRGGKTSEGQLIRSSAAYQEWRLAVFTRDDYTCQHCQVRGVVLHADHIKPFAYYPELRLDVNNGRTLCVECHKKTDTYKAKARWSNSNNQQEVVSA